MLEERLDLLKLAKPVRNQIDDLVRALNAASTRADLEREAQMQIELIGELESGRKVKPADVETLYIIFDDAVQERLQGLEQ
ncbi:hypothetical protein PMM47T1_23082 [Pseudomonas sp. M47T1]|uniref:hypothetical protein n=1 Tax=unclassified Pseudomonas TaxID=196821 RepID=UPI0002607347|nr:hypothetical protein [Pseudomonas sp. M47T1]EIK94148.1 hypothetical protein PMM47T1_23082 [Pseudomonas sp. M47T1]